MYHILHYKRLVTSLYISATLVSMCQLCVLLSLSVLLMSCPVLPPPAVVQEVDVAEVGGHHRGLLAPDTRHAGEDQGFVLGNVLIVSQLGLLINYV